MEGYHSPQVHVQVRLNTNESPVAPPAAWQELLADEVASVDFHRYPDRAATGLRRGIAELHGVGVENVFAANGSNEVLQTLCLTYAGTVRTVVTFEPSYMLHSHIAKISGATVVSGDRDADFAITASIVDSVLERCDPAITFLCSPNNPTGVVDSRELVEYVLRVAPGLVVVDEAYGQFAPRSALDLVDDSRNLVVVRTFSKTWAMAGARLGYLVGPSWLVEELDKVVLPYHLDTVKQLAGRLALHFHAEMRDRVETLVRERERLVAVLTELPVRVWPSGANFVLFRPLYHDANAVWQGLVDRGVLVRNCASWPRLGGCLRVTIGTSAEDDQFLAALGDVLAETPEGAGS